MRKGLLGSIAALTAGAGLAFGQGTGMPAPAPIMPSGLYGGGVMPAAHADPIPSPIGLPPGPGIGAGDPSGGLMPTYPQPGLYGASPYPESGIGGGSGGTVPNWWFNGEYLLWFPQSQRTLQPYVTTSAPGDNGLPGAPTTQTLFSNGNVGYGVQGGFRLTGGKWCDADKRRGFELGGFLVEQKTNIYNAASDPNGVPTLARPFNIAGGGGPGVFLVSNLGLAAGSLTVASGTRSYGVEGNGVINLYRSCPDDSCFWNIDSIVGFRFFQLRETLEFTSNSNILAGGATFIGQPVLAGGNIIVHDRFKTLNQFYGGQLGLRASVDYGRWTLSGAAKCGFGLMHQTAEVSGTTTLQDAALGLNATSQGGLYATRDNIGRYRNDEFAILPEASLNVAYHFSSGFSMFIGYNGIYANRVIRPGTSLPSAVNTALVPASNNFGVGAVTPVANQTLTQTDFWIQGVSIGWRLAY
jgi:hypothetical protein